MRCLLLLDVTQHILVVFIDVSGQPAGPVFKGQAVQEECPAFLLGLFDRGLRDQQVIQKRR